MNADVSACGTSRLLVQDERSFFLKVTWDSRIFTSRLTYPSITEN